MLRIFPYIFTLILIKSTTAYTHHLLYDVDCDFKTQTLPTIGQVYHCEITSDLIVTERHIGISAMIGEHEAGKSIANVNAVNAYLRTINFIPDFTPVTNNLIALSIIACRLLRLRKQDLKPYDKLQYLWINENYLKHLDGEVFIYNLDIKLINLEGNRLTKIDPNIFNNLKSLEVVMLSRNACLKNITEMKLTVTDWITKINDYCQNYPEPIVARPREEYKRNVREKTSILVTFGVTFASFSAAVVVIVILYNFMKFCST